MLQMTRAEVEAAAPADWQSTLLRAEGLPTIPEPGSLSQSIRGQPRGDLPHAERGTVVVFGSEGCRAPC